MEVIFFPRKDYDVEICSHRFGKAMTYTEQTDGLHLQDSYTPFMTLAKARNIRVGAFATYSDCGRSDIGLAKTDEKNGHLWIDEYSLCPSLQEKITHYESPTDEEFIAAYNNELLPAFVNTFGRKPVALSYSYGVTGFSGVVCPRYLGGRNSAYNGDTDYGIGLGTPDDKPYSFSRFCSKSGTIRWYDKAKANGNDFSGVLTELSAKIDETLLNGGWLNNFTHWHNYYSDGNEQWAATYLDMLAAKNAGGQIYFSGYGEAVAYLIYRQIITRAVMYSPVKNSANMLIIRLETNNDLGVDIDLMQVPISIKFSTIGTPLANQSIVSLNRNLISLGNNEYIVEIPFAQFPIAVIKKS